MTGVTGVQSLFDGPSHLVPGVLRGYRTWAGLSLDGRLLSTGMGHSWRAAPFGGQPETARCLRSLLTPEHDEGSPGRDCPCGLYGWYAPDDTRIVSAPIVGVVQASGRVILGEHGFRAERLEVLGVTTEEGFSIEAEQLRQLGYPAFADRTEMLAAFPPDDVSGLVEHRCDGRCADRTQRGNHVNLSAVMSGFQAAMQQAAHLAATSASNIAAFVHAMQAAADMLADDPPSVDPRARALHARQNRNTGPRPGPMFRTAVRAARRGRP